MKYRLNHYAPLLALALIALVGIAQLRRPGPADAEPYHQRVLEAANAMPFEVGHWQGQDIEAPPEAVQLLNPNVLITRAYRNVVTGQRATLLLVHCKSARDLAGHYPPNCYPSHGWTTDGQQQRDWDVAGLKITGMEYRFSYHRPSGTTEMFVADFMIMPDGRILRDMAGVYDAAADYTSKFYGAGQIQLVISADVPQSERDAIFRELVGANRPVIDAMRSGFNASR